MNDKISTKTKVIRILAIITIVLGFAVLIWGFVDYVRFLASATPITLFSRPMIIIYGSFPVMILGFYLYIIGFGKKKVSYK